MAVYKDNNKTKDGRCWYYRTYKKDAQGNNIQFRSKKYLSKKDAQEEEAAFILKRDNPINKPFNLVAKNYFEEMYKTRKESTVYSYENVYKKNIEKYFDNINISDITISNINYWREKMQKQKFQITYLNKMHNILKGIFDYAMKNYGLQNNPVAIIGRFKKPNEEIITDNEKLRYLTFDEFNKFIEVVDDLTWKTFFIFLYYTGMRKGEVQALNWHDIDFKNNEITVNKTLTVKTKNGYKITSTKNYINRKIKMSNTLKEQLILYKKEIQNYTDYNDDWFVFGCERFLPQTTIDNNKHKYFQLSNVNEITIHEFRHSHVSLLVNEYIKSGQTDTAKFFLLMSNRMGHSIKVMQETYLHFFPTIQDEIVDLLDNL